MVVESRNSGEFYGGIICVMFRAWLASDSDGKSMATGVVLAAVEPEFAQ